jgi:hypothetical protein
MGCPGRETYNDRCLSKTTTPMPTTTVAGVTNSFYLSICHYLLLAIQSTSIFASGEAQLVYDLLDGLGCIGNANCQLGDFTPTTRCDYKTTFLECDSNGRLDFL